MMFSLMIRGIVTLCCLSTAAMGQVQSIQISGSQINHSTLKSVAVGDHVRIEKFSIPDGMVDLELDRVTVLTPNAELWVGMKDGIAQLERPDVVILSGIVAGIADSLAYLAVSEYGTNGFIDIHGELISISTGLFAQGKDLTESLKSGWMNDAIDIAGAPSVCGYAPGDSALEPSGPMIEYAPNPNRGATTCRIAGIAVETDWEYTSRLFSGNTNASAAYLVTLIGAISEIYERDFNVRLSIPFLRVWGDNSDPYDAGTGDPLDQIRGEWNATMGDVDRTVTHFFTGRTNTSYGGVAYLGVLCNTGYGYGVSAHLDGSFPYPLVDHNGGNWDVIVASHELGHNFGTGHTHDSYNPVIDGCGNGDCSSAYGGTIMSYCHGCSGGLTNIVLEFHPRVRNVVVGYMDSISCDLLGEGVSAVPDVVETLENNPVEIDALGNDESQSCDSFSLESFDLSSAAGGSIELLAGQGPGGRDMFLYTPALDFDGVDTFDYSIVGIGGAESATVSVSVRALRQADTRLSPIDGLRVKYYQLPALSALPDFDSLIPFDEDVSTSVNYESTGGDFMNSELADDVGAVFTGYVLAVNGGIYTFTTNSDDGSKLYIGDEVVVNNDGLHGMVKVGGTIPLSMGWHRIRIEFFERGGGAGLIATMSGPESEEMNLEGLFISHESSEQCSSADMNADGTLNFFDISVFLELFGVQDPASDITGDGRWNFFDISAFLEAFSDGCP